MAAHRYWRATSFEAYAGGDLELSGFHLVFGGARVDAPATLTASVDPDVSGVVGALQDTDISTSARWSLSAAKTLTLNWDFGGSPVDVGDIRATGANEFRFPLIVRVWWSDNATTWTSLPPYAGIAYAKSYGSLAATIPMNVVKGRVTDLSPTRLTIESGSIKDTLTGVLGEGVGRVKGTVAIKGTPNQFVHRKVRLIREHDGRVIREMWSNPVTGEYDFKYVDELQKFTVVSYDHLLNFRAVISDNLTPELMP